MMADIEVELAEELEMRVELGEVYFKEVQM